MRKVTWRKIFTDFKNRHPHLSSMAVDYCSYDYATILIYFKDGLKATYNYDLKRAKFVK